MDDFDRLRLRAHDTLRSEAFENLTPQQINDMDLTTYARLTGRLAPAEAVHAARRAAEQQEQAAPTPQLPDSAFTEHIEPQGQTLEELALTDDAAFLAWRQNRARGGEGVGIFSGMGSQSAEYRDAAARQAGRTGYSVSNVQEAPQLTGRYVRQEQPDPRSAQARLSNQANLWQGR